MKQVSKRTRKILGENKRSH